MALKISSLSELDAELVSQLQAEFEQLVRERHPEIALERGVFHDLVAYFAGGISGAANQTEVDRLVRSSSLLAIEADPALADPTYVDRVMSNYRITRKAGAQAVGEIEIRVAADVTVVVPANIRFQANGLYFTGDDAYTARPVGSTVTAANDRVLTPVGDGTYSFSINATASDVGEAYNLRRGTVMTPDSFPANFVNAIASTDFKGGADVELNAELLARLQEGIAAKVMQGRINIQALLKEQTQFANIAAVSIIGHGDAEMMRDQHGICPISGGGRLDIYARTDKLPRRVALTKSATLVQKLAAGGVWQLTLSRDDLPGFYDVTQIILPDDPVDTAGFAITEELRSFDMSADTLPVQPDLVSIDEAYFTKYQTAVIRFLDTATETPTLTVNQSRQDYRVVLRGMPLIRELQDFCMDWRWRNLAADIAVKAAVPCFLSINFDIQKGPESTAPDTAAIRSALVAAINNLGFPGQVHASLVAEVVHGFLTSRQALGAISLHGRILKPTGGTRVIRSHDVLQIPDDPANLVTGYTTTFILEESDIGISVVTGGFTRGG